jgi:3-dehydroquinate synthase
MHAATPLQSSSSGGLPPAVRGRRGHRLPRHAPRGRIRTARNEPIAVTVSESNTAAGHSIEPEIRVRVELGPRSYDVCVNSGGEGFGAFARSALESTWSGRNCRRALLVTDANVAARATSCVAALDAVGIAATLAVVPPGEPSKSLDRAADLYDDLVRIRADRHTAIVALGGGVIGDLAGFAAATYARGLPLLMNPTSLLAMVDSSVGGKVGVNHPRAKNIIGAFHQPVGVWIDTGALTTLPARELRCGLAEVIKYGVILDPHFFVTLEDRSGAILGGEPAALRQVVAHSCRLKADVVSRDEREETGLRAILNFGHTIGHAVEAVAGYGSQVLHGEAVAIGMVAEARLAERLGWIETTTTERLVALIDRFGLPTAIPARLAIQADALIDAMGRDKKNQRGKIRFILPRALGEVELTDAPTEADVRHVLAAGS